MPEYDRAHKSDRAQWAPRVEAGGVACWRCGAPIVADPNQRGAGWDLGHRPGRPSLPEHRRCNRSAGGQVGAALTNSRRVPVTYAPRHSRKW